MNIRALCTAYTRKTTLRPRFNAMLEMIFKYAVCVQLMFVQL